MTSTKKSGGKIVAIESKPIKSSTDKRTAVIEHDGSYYNPLLVESRIKPEVYQDYVERCCVTPLETPIEVDGFPQIVVFVSQELDSSFITGFLTKTKQWDYVAYVFTNQQEVISGVGYFIEYLLQRGMVYEALALDKSSPHANALWAYGKDDDFRAVLIGKVNSSSVEEFSHWYNMLVREFEKRT